MYVQENCRAKKKKEALTSFFKRTPERSCSVEGGIGRSASLRMVSKLCGFFVS